jgi:CubicO group peptidase (beta-lactamase class C family)
MPPTLERILASTLDTVGTRIEELFAQCGVPGGGVAIVYRGQMLFARGFGFADRERTTPVTARTRYPIASTTKAINATLIAMLVDDGLLDWDEPVSTYLPAFRLADPERTPQVTLRDLVAMRTGLPRHDWVYIGNSEQRARLACRVEHLALSAGFRETFQYNNLTVVLAGHIAEIVTGSAWEDLVTTRILRPLDMSGATFGVPPAPAPVTGSFHETRTRTLDSARTYASQASAPSGGSIYASVSDMARWALFNLESAAVGGRSLLEPSSLAELWRPHADIGIGQIANASEDAQYGLGWIIDSYRGLRTIWHSGYLFDVDSQVMLIPEERLGVVAFANLGTYRASRLVCEHVIDHLRGRRPLRTPGRYMAETRKRIDKFECELERTKRSCGTCPSLALAAHVGRYVHPGYGELSISLFGKQLLLERGDIRVPLEHWQFDEWISRDTDWLGIAGARPFDPMNPVWFEGDAGGGFNAVHVRFEPSVPPICFSRSQN